MAENRKFSLFGYKIFGKKDVEQEQQSQPSFTAPDNSDGAFSVISAAQFGTSAIDLDGSAKNEVELITRYREMAMQPEVESAIDDIVNEAIVHDNNGKSIEIVMDNLKVTEKIKKAINNEFETILRLLNFDNMGSDIFRRYYVDGRLFYHIIIDVDNPEAGIKELRYIDPRKIRKVREIKKVKDATGVDVVTVTNEYYVYSDKILTGPMSSSVAGVRISPDSILNINSGLMDSKRGMVLSYLHKAIKPLNQLRMIEDAIVIYRLCLIGDTRITTNNGWKYIKDINENDVVYSFWGREKGLLETKVKKQWKTGTKQTYKVKSKHFEITGTDNHPILVLNKSTNIVEYVDIKDLIPKLHSFVYEKPKNKESFVEFPQIRNKSIKITNPEIWSNYKIENKEKYIHELSESLNINLSSVRNFLCGIQFLNKDLANKIINETEISEFEFEEKYEFLSKNAEVNLPNFIDEDFARLFGFMLGDGSVTKNGLCFAEGIDNDQNLFYAKLLEKYFGNCNRYQSKRKYTNYTTSSTLGAELFRKLGFVSGAKNKRIPQWVFQCSNEIKKQLILGIADADGCIKNSKYSDLWYCEIELANKLLIEDIKELWTSIGLSSGHIRYRKREGSFRIIGTEKEPRFMPDSETWNIYLSDLPLPKFETILSVESSDIEDVYELEVESEKHNFIANGITVHNSRAPERRIFYIDVGNLPRIKAEQYVRDVMTKYKNKLVYDATTGEVRDDRRHLCLTMDTKVPLLDGRTLTIEEISKEYKKKDLWAYSCDPITGKFVPGLITWAGVSIPNAQIIKITLDNGKTIECTPEHKFPTWNNGLVEAKNLTIGESMIPLYRKNEKINKNRETLYEQLYNNETKKWVYTHREVSKWKDDNNLENEFTFNEEYIISKKNAIHHKNINSFDNSPENLIKMNYQDHIKMHGFIGTNSGLKHKEKGTGIFNKNNPNYMNWKINSAIKGRTILKELLQNPEWNIEFREKQKKGWTEEKKSIASEHAKKRNLSKQGNLAQKELWKTKEKQDKFKSMYSTEYNIEMFNVVENGIKNNFSKQKISNILNESIDLVNTWKLLNKDKCINPKQKSFDKFNEDDVAKIVKMFAGITFAELKQQLKFRNHKIINIEYLNEKKDTGCLTIDGNEKYHNYHTFALDAGIYTKNSMMEDFWMPRRCISLNTKIKLLDGRDETLETLINEYEEGKQNWVYSVSPEGNIVPGKISWAGITRKNAEIVKITLDNEEIIECTPDHKFVLRDGTLCEAQYLNESMSLMPLYHKNEQISGNHSGTYTKIFDNNTQKWIFSHRMVSEYFKGKQKINEVIHHIDFNRYNNNPNNLLLMDKLEHFKLHSTLGTNAHKNNDTTEWYKKLSESGKKFFTTEEGQLRKEQISKFNKSNDKIINGLIVGRNKIKELREYDKLNLSKEEFYNKWVNVEPLLIHNEQRKIKKDTFDIDIIKNIIIDNFHPKISSKEILFEIQKIYPNFKYKTFKKFLPYHGYNNLYSLIKELFNDDYKRGTNLLYNHKIVKIEFLNIKKDTGTLTIDENHEYHNYHNFALSCGIFIKNSDGKSTEITTLPSGQNLGQLEDVNYFEKKLYKSLNVPVTRLDPQQATSIGRSTEITRDELKFSKFIDKLRSKFSEIFDQALRVQLVLKGVCTEEEWETFKEFVYYDYIKDNNFVELKEAELMQERLGVLAIIDQYSGKYYSKKYIQEHVLRLNDIEIIEMEKQIAEEDAENFKKQTEMNQKQIMLQQQLTELQGIANPEQEPQIMAGDNNNNNKNKLSTDNPYNIQQ